MIRKNQAFLNRVNIFLDILLVVVAYILASVTRLDFLNGKSDNMAAVSWQTVQLAIVYALALSFLLFLLGFYNTTRTRRMIWKAKTIWLATTISLLIAASLLFLFRLENFSRGVIFIFYAITLFFLIGKYAFMRLVLRQFRSKGYNLKHIIVIGTGTLAEQFTEDIHQESELGYHIKGYIGVKPESMVETVFLGGYDALDEALSATDISEAVIALEPSDYGRIREIISACEKNGVKYSVIPYYNDIIPANPIIETIGKSKLINMRVNRLENLGWSFLKRIFDIAVSGIGLIVLSPLLLLIAVGVKLSSPGPILFKQTRVGYGRKEFQMLKFRSMKVNSSEKTGWTKDKDDRRTPFGSLIRKTSLDELPQLFNVLKGDMSLVGPRPELPFFVEQFKETIPLYMVKHQVKPGITGWAQVNGYRGDTSIEKRIELDLWYIEHWSIGLDLKILFRTLFGGMVNQEKIGGGKESK